MENVSIEALRQEALSRKQEELNKTICDRKRKLHELYTVARHIERSKPFPSHTLVLNWGAPGEFGVEEAERKFVEANDLLRGNFFNEATLPTYTQQYVSPPESSSAVKTLPIRTPTPSSLAQQAAQQAAQSPAVPAGKPTSPPAPDGRTLHGAPPAASPPISHPPSAAPASPAQHTPPQPPVAQTQLPTPDAPATPRVPPSPREASPEPPQQDIRGQPPSPVPQEQPAPTPSLAEQRGAAPVPEIGGVPVIQESATRVPDAREQAAGVRPPPPPPLDAEPSRSPTPAPQAVVPPVPPPVPEAATHGAKVNPSLPGPAATPSTDQNPAPRRQLNPPLSITTQLHPPVRAKEPPTLHENISSPVSSIDNEQDSQEHSVNGIISSATSPDATHTEVVGDGLEKVPPVTLPPPHHPPPPQELSPPTEIPRRDSTPTTEATESDLPSKITRREIREQERDIEIPISKPQEVESRVAPVQAEDAVPVQVGAEPPMVEREKGNIDAVPASDDPSAQLQLENELANGEKTIDRAELPVDAQEVAASAAATATPSPARPPATAQGKDDDSLLSEEEEEEDTVQLVGSNGPPSRMATPTEGQVAKNEEKEKQVERVSSVEIPPPSPPQSPKRKEVNKEPRVASPAEEAPPPPPPQPVQEPVQEPATPAVSEEVVQPPREPEAMVNPPPEPPTATVEVKQVTPPPRLDEPVAVPEDATNEKLDPSLAQPLPEDIEIPDAPPIQEVQPVMQTVLPPDMPEQPPAPPLPVHAAVDEPAVTAEIDVAKSMQVPLPAPPQSQPKEEKDEVQAEEKEEPPAIGASEPVSEPVAVSSPPKPVEPVAPTLSPVEEAPVQEAPTQEAPDTPQPPTVEVPSEETPAERPVPALFPASARHKPAQKTPAPPKLAKVVISSAHHTKRILEAKSRETREDEEQQGIIVQRRRNAQAAINSSRARPSPFPPGSKMEALTQYTIEDPFEQQQAKEKAGDRPGLFDALYNIQSMPKNIGDLIDKSSKSVPTEYHQVRYWDSQAARIISRIQELQQQGLWSFCQPRAAPEPPRRKAHWDYLLEEMRWMREDFREERKWKIAVARQVAGWVCEWHAAAPEQRVQQGIVVNRAEVGIVPRFIREARVAGEDTDMADATVSLPDLVHGPGSPMSVDGSNDDLIKQEASEDAVVNLADHQEFFKHLEGPPPAALFGLSLNDTIFSIAPTKAAQDIMDQLPLYSPPKPPEAGQMVLHQDSSKRPFIPVSKFAVARLQLADEEDGPKRKRSRYEYEINEDLYADHADDDGAILNGSSGALDAYGRPKSRDKTMRSFPLPPEKSDVALFRPEFKPTLQRIRTHGIRPPADMPSQPFFECRAPSLWTAEEDDRLKTLAKELNHNWHMISNLMQTDGTFHSGAERRSPWECFERWLGLESVPAETTKMPYYKHVQSRLDLAAKISNNYVNAATNGQAVSQLKRKGTIPMRVERRRNTRQWTLFEAMRKLAKKRETSISKQQQSSRAAQMAIRKQQDAPANNAPMRTPQYFATLKYEKELKTQEMKNQMQAQAMAGRIPGQPNPHALAARLPNGTPLPQPGRPPHLPTSNPAVQRPGLPPGHNTTHLQVPPRGPNRPLSQAEILRLRQLQAQQLAAQQAALLPPAQQAALRAGQLKPPTQRLTHADMTLAIQQRNPNMSNEEASAVAAQQLQQYHAQLASSMSQRNPARFVGTGGTGVLIGANGPVGPGAQQVRMQIVEEERRRQMAAMAAAGGQQGGVSPQLQQVQMQAQQQAQQQAAQLAAQQQAQQQQVQAQQQAQQVQQQQVQQMPQQQQIQSPQIPQQQPTPVPQQASPRMQ